VVSGAGLVEDDGLQIGRGLDKGAGFQLECPAACAGQGDDELPSGLASSIAHGQPTTQLVTHCRTGSLVTSHAIIGGDEDNGVL